MSHQLNQYTVSLSIKKINRIHNLKASDLITDELAMRPHLQYKNVIKVGDGEFEDINVEVSCLGLTKEFVEKQVSEELFEIVCAVLAYPKGISVHILS